MTSTFRASTPIEVAAEHQLDFSDRAIALTIGIAIAIVGVNRPAFGGVPPSVVLVVGAFALSMLLPRVNGRAGARVTTIDVLLVAWLAAKVAVEYFNSAQSNIPLEFGAVLDPVMVVMVVVVIKRRFSTVERVVSFARCLIVPAVGVAGLAVLQVLDVLGVNARLASIMGGSALEARIDNGWDIRGTATIGHWTALGGYLCVCIAVCCALILRAHSRREPLRALSFVLGVLVVGQVTTFTFATIAVSVAILVSMAFVLRPKPSQLLVTAAVAGGLWWTFSSVIDERISKQLSTSQGTDSTLLPESVAFRVNVWTHETIPAISDSMLSGHGLGVYKYIGTGRVTSALSWQSPESEWMRTAVSSGVVVLGLEVITIIAVLVFLWWSVRRVPDRSTLPILVMAAAMVAAMSIHSHMADRAFSLSFWAVIAVVQIVSVSTPTRRK